MKKVSKKKTYTRKKKTYTRKKFDRKSRSKRSRTRSYKQRGGYVHTIDEAIPIIKAYFPCDENFRTAPEITEEVHAEYERIIHALNELFMCDIENVNNCCIIEKLNAIQDNRMQDDESNDDLNTKIINLANSIEELQNYMRHMKRDPMVIDE